MTLYYLLFEFLNSVKEIVNNVNVQIINNKGAWTTIIGPMMICPLPRARSRACSSGSVATLSKPQEIARNLHSSLISSTGLAHTLSAVRCHH